MEKEYCLGCKKEGVDNLKVKYEKCFFCGYCEKRNEENENEN